MGIDHASSAVITGAASGLGRALAVTYARRGYRIGIVDVNMGEAESTRAMVEEAGGSGEVYRCDVRVLDEVEAMAGHFFTTWDEVGILINNAGVAAAGPVGDAPMSEWERVVGTNFWGTVFGCHSFVPHMKEQGKGHIVNVASVAGMAPILEMPTYNAAKAGVISLSETLRIELAPHDIGVTVACPFFLSTNIINNTTYTDAFQEEVARAAMGNVRISVEEAALRIVRAVDRNRLYAFPQFSGRLVSLMMRMSPAAFIGLQARFNKMGVLKPSFLWLVRQGWL